MGFAVPHEGGFTILAHGQEMPPPPDRAVAALLLGLLDAEGHWISRTKTARLLYPESAPNVARNALRQALFRLRRWIGEEIVESRPDLIRLTPGTMAVRWDEDASPDGVGLDHPWIDAIWNARRKRASVPHFMDFARAIESTAEVDRDAARGILVGGSALVVNMPTDAATRLLNLTKPADAGSTLAFEHLALRGELYLHGLFLDGAKAALIQAYRLAVQRRSAAKAFRAASMAAFASIEAGDMKGAAAWLDRCAGHARTRPEPPLLINVRAAFLWNAERVAEAVRLMREAIPDPDAANAAHLLHYWTNFALLAAESGDAELALRADEEATRLAKPEVHVIYLDTLRLARATSLMNRGRLDESLRAFAALREEERGDASRAYIEEGYAEVLARVGESERAVGVWSRAEARRRAANLRLTPRLEARKTRILCAS